jgi:DNA sulfur modification protein DndD
VILDTLTLHDFGVYRGQHTIELEPKDRQRPIILIGGLNGEGKTTILDALRLALYGKRAICSNRNGRAYEDFLASCIHHGDDGLNAAGVEVQFHRTADGRDEVYDVTRTWTRTASGVRERLSVLLNGEEDRVLSEMWDDRVEAFLPQEISRLFFFDGERIEALADVDAATDFLRTAIGGLLGLDLVTLLQADLKVLRRNQKLAIRNKAERERLQQAEQDIRQLQKRKQATVAERDALYKAVEDNRKLFRDADRAYQEMGGGTL